MQYNIREKLFAWISGGLLVLGLGGAAVVGTLRWSRGEMPKSGELDSGKASEQTVQLAEDVAPDYATEFGSLAELIPSLKEVPQERLQAFVYQWWRNRGFAWHLLNHESDVIGQISPSEQVLECPFLQVTLSPSTEGVSGFSISGSRILAGWPHLIMAWPEIGERIAFSVLNGPLAGKVMAAQPERIAKGRLMCSNFLPGDFVHLECVDFQTSKFVFSKQNPHTWTRIPPDARGGLIYEWAFDIPTAIAYDKKRREEDERDKWLQVTIPSSSTMGLRKRCFYWEGSSPEDKLFQSESVKLPRQASGAPMAVFEENRDTRKLWAYVKMVPDQDVNLPDDADWRSGTSGLISLAVMIPSTYLPEAIPGALLLSPTEPVDPRSYMPVYAGIIPARDATQEHVKVDAVCFAGKIWAIVKPINSVDMADFWISPITVQEGVDNQEFRLEKMTRVKN